MEIRGAIEAILFVAETPITTQELAEVVEAPHADVEAVLEDIEREFTDRQGGFVLREIAGGWRLYTAPDMLPYVERFATSERATRLSNAAREIGTAPGPGQALLYGTTELFLEKLGVNTPQDLPPLADHVPPAEIVETLERPFRPEGSSNDSRS